LNTLNLATLNFSSRVSTVQRVRYTSAEHMLKRFVSDCFGTTSMRILTGRQGVRFEFVEFVDFDSVVASSVEGQHGKIRVSCFSVSRRPERLDAVSDDLLEFLKLFLLYFRFLPYEIYPLVEGKVGDRVELFVGERVRLRVGSPVLREVFPVFGEFVLVRNDNKELSLEVFPEWLLRIQKQWKN